MLLPEASYKYVAPELAQNEMQDRPYDYIDANIDSLPDEDKKPGQTYVRNCCVLLVIGCGTLSRHSEILDRVDLTKHRELQFSCFHDLIGPEIDFQLCQLSPIIMRTGFSYPVSIFPKPTKTKP